MKLTTATNHAYLGHPEPAWKTCFPAVVLHDPLWKAK